MKTLLTAFVLVGAMTLTAQTAKVVQLSPEDAATAKALHDEQLALDKKRDALELRIKRKYIAEVYPTRASACVVPPGGSCIPPPLPPPTAEEQKIADNAYDLKPGWGWGFEYS